MSTNMKLFIELRCGNKWVFIGKVKYILPENDDSSIVCLAQSNYTDRNYLLNYIISGYCDSFAKGIGGVQLIERREIPTTGEDKCSKYILNALDYDIEDDSAFNSSYVLLSELLDIAKLEPFNLHGFININPAKYSYIASILPQIICDGVFDVTNMVISNLENIDDCKKNSYKFINFQSKCVTHFIEHIKDIIKIYTDTEIFDEKNNIKIPPENIRIVFWFTE